MGIKEEKHVESRTNNSTKNGVLITVYLESTILIPARRKNNPIKRFNPNRSTHGYDRRAQLLAYAQELRHSISHQEEFTMKNSRPRAARVNLYIRI
ncbi:hypothetical protein Vadar_018870 [Vaccinium darrowii]|uniref:Uncharacterized protein n=1 Tax=Vaccinium darrowii TaxID=229202 RepID=A0ACB7Z794_9ERIC|nr:hypothetical protein Vadar_018870 [Vaccinium darrowii]